MNKGRRIDKLIEIASEALGHPCASLPEYLRGYTRAEELFDMLKTKNGFYGFEHALHVFPVGSDISGTMTLEDWNSRTLWRGAYGAMTDGLLFFAEDIFGDQFCLSTQNDSVLRFDAGSGEISTVAGTMEEWADRILSHYEVETGWPLAHEWQITNGRLPFGSRLQPKIPFIMGGQYAMDNLWAGDAIEGMLFKGHIALQVKDLPDGTRINLRVKRN